MSYSITTKDGITINNIPDDIDPNSQVLRDRVAAIRAESDQSQQISLTPEQQRIVNQSESKIQSLQEDLNRLSQVRDNPNLLEQVFGGIEGFLSVGSGLIAAPVSGLEAIGETLNPFSEPGAGAERQKQVQEALTFQPQTAAGKSVVQDVSEFAKDVTDAGTATVAGVTAAAQGAIPGQNIADQAKTFKDIADRGVKRSLGEDVTDITGSPFLGSIASILPDATLSLLGVPKAGVARLPGQTTAQAGSQSLQARRLAEPFSSRLSTSDRAVAQLLLDKSDDISTSKVKLSAENLKSKLTDGLARLVNDKTAKKAIGQGLSEKGAAIIKASTPAEVINIRRMVNTSRNALRSGTSEALERVGGVVGDTLLSRINAVTRINRRARSNLNSVAESQLTNQRINNQSILRRFSDDLQRLDINLRNNALDFEGSALPLGTKGATSARNILTTINRRLNAAGDDALKLHKLKKLIDQQVNFGKTSSGAPGAAEGILKNLRREVDSVLDAQFPRYRDVNDRFSQTRRALDNFQDAAGRSINLTGGAASEALGTKLRSLTNNTNTRSNLLNSMAELEDVLVRNGVRFKDRIVPQAIIANELETLLKLSPKTGLKSTITEGAIDAVTGQTTSAAARTGKAAADIIKGRTPEKALDAIENLLTEVR